MGNLVSKMPFTGKKGDTLHIPMPKRGEVYAKVAGAAVTLQGNAESEITVVVNKHYEYSRFIEDFAAVQALSSAVSSTPKTLATNWLNRSTPI
jgi:hypothetical protein